jgi:putative Mg2+ transporter-C (MgtC) family protein
VFCTDIIYDRLKRKYSLIKIMPDSVLLHPNDWLNVVSRFGVALLIGGLIGWTRQVEGKAAGLRTHMLVTVTAALLVLIPSQLNVTQPEGVISYVLQGISTGIGFLGAGVILRQSDVNTHQSRVKGLTSASEIWVCGALGACSGCGLWILSFYGTVLMLIILTIIKHLERFIPVHSEDDF